MADADKPNPCPYCGSGNVKVYVQRHKSCGRQGIVRCEDCGMDMRVAAYSPGMDGINLRNARDRITQDLLNRDIRRMVVGLWNQA